MDIVYFVSSSHPYQNAIYFGVGPSFGEAFGWRVAPINELPACNCDVGILDNRLEPADIIVIDSFLNKPAGKRFPIFFRISDPDMPLSANPCVQFIFSCKDKTGVHFATTYDPEGPFLDFVKTLGRSRVIALPYPYEKKREADIDLALRRRRVFLSGANDPNLYPLRYSLRRRRKRNLILRALVTDLPHPGYPDGGASLTHRIVRDRFVEYAAQFTHFFLCPARYESELAKYTECAYAGSVPLGMPPKSIKNAVKDCFITWRGDDVIGLARNLFADMDESREKAAAYRKIMRGLRDPAKLALDFEQQASACST